MSFKLGRAGRRVECSVEACVEAMRLVMRGGQRPFLVRFCSGSVPADVTVPGTCFYPHGITDTTATVEVHIRVTVTFITPIISNIWPLGITVEAVAQQLVQS